MFQAITRAALCGWSKTSDWIRIREEAAQMEQDAERFYRAAAETGTDAATRKLLGDLAAAEAGHSDHASELEEEHLDKMRTRRRRDAAHRQFMLTWVQPGLAGLMDGSVSTLAPIFAVAFATQDTWTTFLVGLAASVGAGISMGFTEAASDDGQISGRGSPYQTRLRCWCDDDAGRVGSCLAVSDYGFLDGDNSCVVVVFVELWAIAWIQNRYMQTPFMTGRVSGGAGRCIGLCRGCIDRLGLDA